MAVQIQKKPLYASVQGKIIAIIVLCGLVPLLLLAPFFTNAVDGIKKHSEVILTDKSRSLNEIIDRNLFERYGDVQAFVKNGYLFNPKKGYLESSGNLSAAINAYMTNYGVYKAMAVVTPGGAVLAANSVDGAGKRVDASSLYRENFRGKKWFEDALKENYLKGKDGFTGTVVGEPEYLEFVGHTDASDGYVVPFAAPIKDGAGRIVGVWVNFFDFKVVDDIVSNFAANNADFARGHIEILDSAGVVISRFDSDKKSARDKAVIGKLNIAEKGDFAASQAVIGKNGFSASDESGLVSGYSNSQGAYGFTGLGWSAIIRVPASDYYQEINSFMSTGVVAAALGLAVLLVLGFILGGIAAKPIRQIAGVVRALAQDNFSVEVPYTERKDEIGSIARAVRTFRENALKVEQLNAEQEAIKSRLELERKEGLHNLAHEFENNVMGIVGMVSSASSQMEATAGNVAYNADDSSKRAAAVATAATESAHNVHTVAAAAEELSASVQEITKQVARSASIAHNAVSEARQADETVQSLSAAAQKIGDVVDLINDIAEQINLLALNATIEAARAGEAGKGFAVVASEVKTLATQTANATGEITAQIAAIQSVSGNATAVIKGISSTINEMNSISSSIAAAVEEQGAATKEIARNIQHVASGTSEVTRNIEKLAVGSSETVQAASQMLQATNELSRQSETLRGKIDEFLNNVRA